MEISIQQIFNNAWEHFVVQRQSPSIDTEIAWRRCLYRGPNGTKCAIGVSIPDSLYNPNLEGKSGLQALAEIGITVNGSLEALRRLQNRHDYCAQDRSCDFHKTFEAAMRNIAQDYRLQCP